MPLTIHTKPKPRPPRIVVYGGPGIGKTTLASYMPDPLIIPIEEGADGLECRRTDSPETWSDLITMLDQIAAGEAGSVGTLALDSLSAAQDLAYAHVCAEAQVESIEGIGYGKGYVRAGEIWQQMLGRLDACRARGMAVMLIAHQAVVKHEDPRLPAWDRMIPRLQINGRGSGIGPMTVEWSDAVLCAAYRTYTTDEQQGMRTRTTGVGDGERILYCEERPAYLAKNRYNMPPDMPMDVGHILSAIKIATQPTTAQS